MINPESKSKWLTDSKKREYLFLKSNLIDLFTISKLPVAMHTSGTNPTVRNIGDIIDYSEYKYTESIFINYDPVEIIPTTNADLFAVIKINNLSLELNIDSVYTDSKTLISYKLINFKKVNSLKDFEYLNKLTPEQISYFSKSTQFTILYLKKLNKIDQFKGYNLFTDMEYNFGIIYSNDHILENTKYIVLSKYGEPAYSIYEEFNLYKEDIENYYDENSSNSIITTYGRYLANYYLLASVFGNKIPYQNKEMSFGKIESMIADKIKTKEVTTQQGSQYLDNAFFIGSFGEMCVPTLTRKSLTTSPEVKKRKKELLEKYKNQLDDPAIASQIEEELIELDKEWLKGDPSLGFYGDSSKKFNVHRKKLFLTNGLTEDFTKEQGNYSFIEKSLSEGWDISSFVTICNDIRRGSYNRGIDTAKGGTKTKQLMRLLQNLKITNEDCGTKRYLNITLDESNIKNFYGRYVLDEDTKKLVVINEQNQNKYINKPIKLRSFMYCEQKDGFCHICGGEFFKNLDQDVVGVLALELTSTFTKLSLKSMHGSKLETLKIDNLDKFVI